MNCAPYPDILDQNETLEFDINKLDVVGVIYCISIKKVVNYRLVE
jgi:hypothetical protein